MKAAKLVKDYEQKLQREPGNVVTRLKLAATLRELARVVRPGGTIASLEFGVPPAPVPQGLWRAYVDVGLPLAGRLIAPGWAQVGRFLGSSIREFYERWPLERLLAAWNDAGIREIRGRRLSFGGGVVIWGRRE